MSRSSFQKAYEEIANLNPMEMTFTIEDADLDKLHEVLKDINVRECPWFEVQDKHGNKAKYYREPQWIPCSERLPNRGEDVLVTRYYHGKREFNKSGTYVEAASRYGEDEDVDWCSYSDEYKENPKNHEVVAWMPLPEPYKEG